MLRFNDTSILVGHFVSSPRERKKRDRRDSRDEREGQERKRNRNESEETKEKKTLPPLPLSATMIGLAQLEAEVILEGEKVSLSWLTSPYLELREK